MVSASSGTNIFLPNLSKQGNQEGDAIEPQRRKMGIDVERNHDGLISSSGEANYKDLEINLGDFVKTFEFITHMQLTSEAKDLVPVPPTPDSRRIQYRQSKTHSNSS